MNGNNNMDETEIHHHAAQRAKERGATIAEVMETVAVGEEFPAKYERQVSERTFLLIIYGMESIIAPNKSNVIVLKKIIIGL